VVFVPASALTDAAGAFAAIGLASTLAATAGGGVTGS